MATQKQAAIKPMPFPGESPTVALAMAAGQQYGLHEEEPDQARPKRRAASRKHLTKARRKATLPKKAASGREAAPKRKSASAKKAMRAGKNQAASKAKRAPGAGGR